ncbi:MAG: FeoA family protein [Campylobacterota bacterium]|nr:FeoA family protein [Campylobacterota bacterium]
MKKLSQCNRGERAKVIKLNAKTDLKQRLISFGVMKGATIEILEHAPAKSTVEIKVGKMRIALRAEEADLIDIELL